MSDIAVNGSEQKKSKKKRTAGSLAAEFFIRIAVTVLFVWLMITFVTGIYICHGDSSYPMIKDGDLCITLRPAKPHQGDLIACRTDDGVRFMRVIAFGGDTVDFADQRVIVNGSGIYEDVVYPTSAEGADISFPYTVPDDTFFVLNDHRGDVSDSRTFGGISADDYKGKIIFVMRRRGF